ncbi:PcfJ domain-containing protein [Clostridium tagluense]|uniref:PcfJ domain-containing protein n=1 Tax=Clostridium tagluense TaxID=360422 RepID=UPI001CF14225|nr:PcfJ domain-containing protein [Clostridium tagluense]MCB2297771.1 PcfJ domain-containing protein [Clostridium tagluense]
MYEDYLEHVNLAMTEQIRGFVKDGVFRDSEYLFIEKVDGTNKAYCSMCNTEFAVGNINHNEDGMCPCCATSIKAKLLRYGRKNCTNEACFYFFEKSTINPNIIVCKGYYVNKNYSVDYKNPKMVYDLCAIYIFENKKATMFKKDRWGHEWQKKSSIFDFNQEWLATKMCYCSFESIGKAIKGTSFEYLPYKTFQGHHSMVKLFSEYSKYHCIEYLVKEGFANLVADKLDGCCTFRSINWNGKTIFKVLKISKLDLREIKSKKVHVTFNFLKVLQDAKKRNWNLTIEETINVANEYLCCYDSLQNALKYSSMKKLLNYFSKQFDNYNIAETGKHYYGKSSVLTTFRDYISDCILLEMDTTKDQVIFPKNLFIAHQNTIKQIKMQKDGRLDVLIKNRVKLLEKYIFECNGLSIRPAGSSDELIKEGAALTHCVGGYADRYAKGETDIFFIRKITEPDKPYYTIEIKKDKIIQVHGKNNRSPSEDVKQFISIFTRKKLEKQTKKNRIRLSA